MGLFNKKKKAAGSGASGSQLKISLSKNGTEYIFALEGRLDTVTSPELERKVDEVVGGAEKLIFDLEKLDYISSAGLRVLLGSAQAVDSKGDVVVRNLTQSVRDVFDLTGFNHLFNIETGK